MILIQCIFKGFLIYIINYKLKMEEKIKKKIKLCEHKKQKYFCVDCKGKGICEHNH